MYKVYVGCLPAYCTAEELAEFFSQIANIHDTRVSRKPGSKLCSGNGVFSCVDRDSFEAIVATREFDFHGRVIFCEGMLSGEALLHKNLMLSRRRVFVSNLPPRATDQQIADVMRWFGAVQNGYRILTLTRKPRPFGFVTFFDEASAQNAIATGSVLLHGQFVFISPFKRVYLPNKGTKTMKNPETRSAKIIHYQKSVQTRLKAGASGAANLTGLSATTAHQRSMEVGHGIKPTSVRYHQGWLGLSHGATQVHFHQQRRRGVESQSRGSRRIKPHISQTTVLARRGLS